MRGYLRVLGMELFSFGLETADEQPVQFSLTGGDFERLIEPEEYYEEEDKGFGFR